MDSHKLNTLLEEWDKIQEQIVELAPVVFFSSQNDHKIFDKQLDQLKAQRGELRLQIKGIVAGGRPDLW